MMENKIRRNGKKNFVYVLNLLVPLWFKDAKNLGMKNLIFEKVSVDLTQEQ